MDRVPQFVRASVEPTGRGCAMTHLKFCLFGGFGSGPSPTRVPSNKEQTKLATAPFEG